MKNCKKTCGTVLAVVVALACLLTACSAGPTMGGMNYYPVSSGG